MPGWRKSHRAIGDGPAGNFFGTTTGGGRHILGTAFELENVGGGKYKFKTIFSFSQIPNNGALVIDTAENLYGFAGGFFKLSYGFGAHHDKWGTTEQQVSCSVGDCGNSPVGTLTYAGQSSGAPYDGSSPLYGVMQSGGSNGGGLVYELTPNGANSWTETVLYNFCSVGGNSCTDGNAPSGGLYLDAAGNLFGLTDMGGNQFNNGGAGVAYEVSANEGAWMETVLYSFCSAANCTDGAMPVGQLVAGPGGILYGATRRGGSCRADKDLGCGTIFSVTPAGKNPQQTVLYRFCAKKDCRDGRLPVSGPTMDASGTLFGTTVFGGGNDIDDDGAGGGVAYQVSGQGYTVLHSFCSAANCADGEYPETEVAVGADGVIYGTTAYGGEVGQIAGPGGVVFKILR